MEKTIKIPKALHEVHGESASLLDLILPHGLSIISSIYLLNTASDADFGIVKSFLLFILTYDLIGGVIANFTEGTSRFYAANTGRRIKFIALHILQPTIMWYLFKDHANLVLFTSLFTVGAAILVNQIKPLRKQLVVSGTLVLMGLICFQYHQTGIPFTLQFLLTAFILKLPLAWAVRWFPSTISR